MHRETQFVTSLDSILIHTIYLVQLVCLLLVELVSHGGVVPEVGCQVKMVNQGGGGGSQWALGH